MARRLPESGGTDPPMYSRIAVLLLLLLPAACGTPPDALPATVGPGPSRDPAERLELARATSAPEAFTIIARLEDARSDGDGLLALLADHGDAGVRASAVTALGRLPTWSHAIEVTESLVRALDDESNDVRAAAAFALGMRADAAAESGILAHRSDGDARVRARLVEAASKIATPALQALVLEALADPATEVRVEAAEGPLRFPARAPAGAPAPDEVDRALIALATDGAAPAGPSRSAAVEEARWRAMASLSRRKPKSARDLFLDSASGIGEPRWMRFFAVKGLADPVPPVATRASGANGDREDYAVRTMLEQCATDSDWLIAGEAVRGLGRLGDERSLAALARAAKHASPHVRAAAVEALVGFSSDPGPLAAILLSARTDRSRSVRAAAIIAQAKLFATRMASELSTLARDPDPVVRRAAALGAAELPEKEAASLLLEGTRDADPFVSTAAVGAAARHTGNDDVRARLLELLLAEDNGLRLASAEVLRDRRVPVELASLREARRLSIGDIGPETRVMLLRLADAQPSSDEQTAYLVESLSDSDAWVRRIAHELSTARGGRAQSPARDDELAEDALAAPADTAEELRNPRVSIVTTRGTLEFELFPTEAPRHVASFLELASRDHYDGLTFHRVVPGFVVQGGCYRGDGNGGGTSRGPALRHEIGPRKYARGSLGMPRNDDPESGGSQFFVTHVPTPHLDGRYTVFGELRSGFEVLDMIEVGDRILDVR